MYLYLWLLVGAAAIGGGFYTSQDWKEARHQGHFLDPAAIQWSHELPSYRVLEPEQHPTDWPEEAS